MQRPSLAQSPLYPQRGFTLLEILVVVVIIGILTAMLLPNLASGGRWRDLQREADTLAMRIRVAQDDAMLYGREYGIVFSQEGYRFVAWDAATARFREPDRTENWMLRRFDDDIRVAAALDADDPILVLPEPDETTPAAEAPVPDATGAMPADDAEDIVYQPSVYVLSSGEVTPFTAELRADGEENVVLLRIDSLGNRIEESTGEGGDNAPST